MLLTFILRVRNGGTISLINSVHHQVPQLKEVSEHYFDWIEGLDLHCVATVVVLALGTRPLIVVNRNLLINPVLHQRIHDGTVDLSKESSGVMVVFRNDDETVVVQDVAVQLVACASVATNRRTGALKTFWVNIRNVITSTVPLR